MNYNQYTFKQIEPDVICFTRDLGNGAIETGSLKRGQAEFTHVETNNLVPAFDSGAYQSLTDSQAGKIQKQTAIQALTVEVDGMVFQANELSQQRMDRAIQAAGDLAETSYTWRLANNTNQTITLAQLKEAHTKAMVAFGAIILGD